jgi:hypothetical protein
VSRSPFDDWEKLHQPVPATLYHYTTASGLLSMLKSGHVWATESRYMNDPREFVHGAELMLKVISDRSKGKRHPGLERVRQSVERHVAEKLENVRIFCMSFCTDGDLLSQWRGYGDIGGGYALGFYASDLLGLSRYERPPFRVLRRAVYDHAEQRRLVEAWVQGILDGYVAEGNPLFWRFFSEALISFKDKAYAEEDEWRLIQFGRAWSANKQWLHPVQFRERKGKIIPYGDLDLTKSSGRYAGRLPISEIVHGPIQDPERSGKALRLLIESCRYNEGQIGIRFSKVPFSG